MNASRLTIVIVAGPNDELYIRENIQLIAAKNQQIPRIVIVDNGAAIDAELGIKAPIAHAEIIPGMAQPQEIPEHLRGSYQHAAALNHTLRQLQIASDYLLVLDPDFYMIYPQWIGKVTDHMDKENLSFFGAPWHPRWYPKYRYFPCVHCLFMNTRDIDPKSLDFTPDLVRSSATPSAKKAKTQELKPSLMKALKTATVVRRNIDRSDDTGYLLKKRFYTMSRFETLKPVATQADLTLAHMKFALGRMFEAMVPDRFSYWPKQKYYISAKGFREAGLHDTRQYAWEEFMWHGKPFGFHMRRFNKGPRDLLQEIALVKQILSELR